MKWKFSILVLVLMYSDLGHMEAPQNITSNPCTDQNHIFLAPGVLSAGGANRACLSRFHPDGSATMTLSLFTGDTLTSTAARDLPPGDGGCLDISVPQLTNALAQLVVNVRYLDAQCTWERALNVRVSSGRVLTVLTERARYRPGDVVRIRLLTIKPDFTPGHGMIDEVWLEGPRGAWEGSRAAWWSRVRTRLGVAQLQHSLDELAPPGRWTVRARLGDGSQGAAAFWVGNYELPPFQLSVRHPPKVLRTSERLVWTVCVRYPWTEAVEGMLVIRIRGTPGDAGPGIRTAVRLRSPRACHRHAAAARRIGLDTAHSPDVVVADFSFQEEGTRIWQNTTVVSRVVDKAVTLEFLTKHRAVISPGLPYKLKIKATRWDDKPAANERIRTCRSPANHPGDLHINKGDTQANKGDLQANKGEKLQKNNEEKPQANTACSDAITDMNGIARVMFTTDDNRSPFYQFQATLQNDTTTAASPLYLPVHRSGSAHAALGALKPDPHATRTFVPLYLNMKNLNHALTVHFVVITRGGIIYRWGATTQCPVTNSATQIQTAPRNSPCNAYLINKHDTNNNRIGINNKVDTNSNFNEYDNRIDVIDSRFDVNVNDSDSLLDRHNLRVMLPIKVTHQMCPDSHLIAYFYYNGELVSASKHFEMEECFANKVEATWLTRLTPPGSSTSLQISTPGPALCALTAIDSAAKWIQPMENVKDVILAGLRRVIEEHRNLTVYDAAGECFLTSDAPETPVNSAELAETWLAEAGVRIIGGNVRRTKTCNTAPAPMIANDVMVPRSDFSEAWLWRLVPVPANGTTTIVAQAPDSITRYEASTVCISRAGLAVSTPAVLQVFREFFIHADTPRRLRRGDSTIMQYRIFNYLYEPLSVQIQILTDAQLEGPKDYVEMACINARSSIARRVEIQAKQVGNARVSVRAKSVTDGSCNNVTTSKNGVSDEVIIQMTIDPEGVPVQDHKSTMLCGRGSPESSSSFVSWSWSPVRAVPGTEALTVWAVGDIAGPLLVAADDLIRLPRGCGEQNMARLATNLLALQQLDPHSAAATIAREHVARGFTRQLQYTHPAGGFSAFGASDAVPSTWLTAFSVRYLRKAHQVLTPELPAPPVLNRAEQWLLNQQMENGCFRNEGQVFHRELKGGLNEEGEIASVALTAYVITSLLDTSVLPARVLRNTLSCLRALPLKSKAPNKIYAHSLLAYTFMKLIRYEDDIRRANEASLWDRGDELQQDEEMRELVELLRLARRKGDLLWWETGSLSTSIEATSYALLALAGCPEQLRHTSCELDGGAALRWLATHRSAAGGFVSTQDTLVALEAITTWSKVHPFVSTDLNVTVRGKFEKTLTLRAEDKVPEVVKMSGNQVSVNIEGTGCALIQATRSYNAYTVDEASKLLSVQVSVRTDGAFDCDANATNCYCAAVVEACVVWAGEFPEMVLLELALPGGYGADAAMLYSQLQTANTLLRRIELAPNSGRATLYLGTRDGSSVLGRGGHHCYNVHAVGPQYKTKPAYVRVMDYYNPAVNDTQMYTIPEECPPRIAHDSNQYLPTDNLFNKAKSLSDSEEIVITNEFSFEDIPEGIPLEDPLYDNIKKAHNNVIENLEIPIEQHVETQSKLKNKSKKNDTVESTEVSEKELNRNCKNDSIKQGTNSRNISRKVKVISDKLNFDKSTEYNVEYNRKGKQYIQEVDNEPQVNTETKKDSENEIVNDEYKIEINDKINNTTDYSVEFPSNQPQEESIKEFKQAENSKDIIENQKLKEMDVGAKEVENPNLADFHVIDSEKDLEVPSGLEGPVPVIVLPPSFKPRGYVAVPYDAPVYQLPWTWLPPDISRLYLMQNYQSPAHHRFLNRRYNSPTG